MNRQLLSEMISVISRFTVINGMEEEVRDAFVNRPHLVEHAPGFIRLEVHHCVENPSEFWLLTWWESQELFNEWHKKHRHESHQFMPKGLRLDPRGTEIKVLTHIAS